MLSHRLLIVLVRHQRKHLRKNLWMRGKMRNNGREMAAFQNRVHGIYRSLSLRRQNHQFLHSSPMVKRESENCLMRDRQSK